MKIKLEKLYNFIIILIIMISLFSYEVHVYQYYTYVQMLVLVLLLVLLLVFIKYEKELKTMFFKLLKKNLLLFLILFFALTSTMIGNLISSYGNIKSIFSVLGMFFTSYIIFLLIPILSVKYKKLQSKIFGIINLFCICLSIMAILIYYNGYFLSYSLVYGRAASIYYDPNFLAMLLGTNMLLLLSNKTINKFCKICLIFLFFFVIFLSGSRGALIGIVLTLIIFIIFFSKIKNIKKFFLSIIILFFSNLVVSYLLKIDFFRLYQGSNGRTEMILAALKEVKNSPIVGYGYSSIGKFLKLSGFDNSSTHNTFVDYIFSYGILNFLLYICFIVKILFKGLKNNKNQNLILVLCFLIFNMNTILYNFGGVGISSFLFTLILGYIYINGEVGDLDENKYNCSNI